MSELMIRPRETRTFAATAFQGTAKAEKQSSSAPAQKTEEKSTVNISDTLRELMTRVGQTEGQLRESRSILQMGQAVLDEVQDTLNRIADLTEEAAEGEEPDREAIQAEVDKLAAKIDRMLSSLNTGDKPLFVEGKAELIEGILSGEINPEDILDAVKDLLQKLADGIPPETLMDSLDMSSPLLSLLTGLTGMNFDMLMGILSALESSQTALAPAQGQETAAQEAAVSKDAPAETAKTVETAAPAETAQTAPMETVQFGGLRIIGQDLSGVTYDEKSDEVVIAGEKEVTVQGTEQGKNPAIRLAGSGQVTIQDVKTPTLTVAAPQVHVVSRGENQLGEVRMERDTVLVLEGNGQTRMDALEGNASNLLRLNSGVLTENRTEGRSQKEWTVPIVVDASALLMAQAANVRGADGKDMGTFDQIWKALVPGWSALTQMEVDGKQIKQLMQNGEQARLWLDKGDPNHGYTVHTLMVQGKDQSEELRGRYAFLRWEQQIKRFREINMYPNPFTVTGGEEQQDWVYEEGSHTLRILTSRVSAIAGGMGTDAQQQPFSGRVVLADHIALITLLLNGVECRVPEGKAFDLGRDNEVTLVLASKSKNIFESGDGQWGISMGEDSHVNISYAEGPVGILAATIGTDIEPEEEGISIQIGGGKVTLPQFKLSSGGLRLDMMKVTTQEYARAAMAIVDADRRWVEQIQAVYQGMYGQLEQSKFGFPGGQQMVSPVERLVRDTGSAGALVDDMKRTILLHPEMAAYIHSRRGREDARRLLK